MIAELLHYGAVPDSSSKSIRQATTQLIADLDAKPGELSSNQLYAAAGAQTLGRPQGFVFGLLILVMSTTLYTLDDPTGTLPEEILIVVSRTGLELRETGATGAPAVLRSGRSHRRSHGGS